jgi:dipeptide/tripeptide permease
MVYYGIMAILPPVAGWLRDRTGGATTPVLFGGMLMALTIFALAAFRILQQRWPVEESEQLIKAST